MVQYCCLNNMWSRQEKKNLIFHRPGPEVIKLFSCSTQPSMKFFLLRNVIMPTIVGILISMSGRNSILGLSEPKKADFLYCILMSI